MKEQHKNVKSTKKKAEKEKFVPAEPENDFGFVAVAAGNGLKDLLKTSVVTMLFRAVRV